MASVSHRSQPGDSDMQMPQRDRTSATQRIIAEFRATGGTVGGYFAGMPLLLLTTVGRRSGELRTVPLTYMADAERLLVTAADAGSADDPAWYRNLQANPEVTVEVGRDVFAALAREAGGKERDELYRRFAAEQPQADVYQARTRRRIPVIVLSRR